MSAITSDTPAHNTSPNRPRMIQRSYTVRFLTPAFLGNAEQSGEWRTPPFKALLRQWWRVAYVRGRSPTPELVSEMREVEGRLFGNAWLEANAKERGNGRKNGHSRSLVRIRLDNTVDQKLPSWSLGSQVGVTPLSTGIDTSYSWFGLIKRRDSVTKVPLPDRTGVKAGCEEGERVLRLAYPEDRHTEIHLALRLIDAFGQVGSRARTGWGAVQIEHDTLEALSAEDLRTHSRNGNACLDSDWPHALGSDEQGLWLWEHPEPFADWSTLLTRVAPMRREIRCVLKGPPDLRPILGFAESGQRMPSPLRWRAVTEPNNNSLRIRVFAFPHRIPEGCVRNANLNRHTKSAWQAVVHALDHSELQRLSVGRME